MSAISIERSQSASVTIGWLSLNKNRLTQIRRTFRFPQQTLVINTQPQVYRDAYTLGSQYPERKEIELFTHPLLWGVEKPLHLARRLLTGESLKIPYPMEVERQQRITTAIYDRHTDDVPRFHGNQARIQRYAEQATRGFSELSLKRQLTPAEARERAEKFLTKLGAKALKRITAEVLAHEYGHTKQSRKRATIDVVTQELAKILGISLLPEAALLLTASVISLPILPWIMAGALSLSALYAVSKLVKMKKNWNTDMLTKIHAYEERYAFKKTKKVSPYFQDAVTVDEGRLRQMLFHEPPLQGAITNRYTVIR